MSEDGLTVYFVPNDRTTNGYVSSDGELWFPPDHWPEAVRSGQADIAGKLLAAHVELERRRAEKGIVDVR